MQKLFYFLVVLLLIVSCKNKTNTNSSILVNQSKFDTTVESKKNALYTLANKNCTAQITNYGARMVSFIMPDKNKKPIDLVVGFDNIHGFITGAERYFGAIVGRYGNRIAGGKFTLDGVTYNLDLNNGPNSLHGGRTGIHSRVWNVENTTTNSITLSYLSKDMEEGYPGNLTTKVTYTLLEDHTLQMDYDITTDKKTVVNVTNHNYWNLNGSGSGTINNHSLQIAAQKFTTVDSTLIPNGVLAVANTPFDFVTSKTIGSRINNVHTQLQYGKGYDHNYILDKGMTAKPELAAVATGDKSGIVMTVLTTEPGLQFYGGNFMQSKNNIKGGLKDEYRTAFCLETQHFPDAPNQPQYLTTVLLPGTAYKSSTIHKFEVK